MSLYRIAFVADSQAHSLVRELAIRPVPGDELTLDANTVVAVRDVVEHPAGDTITAEIVAETVTAPDAATGSAFRSSS